MKLTKQAKFLRVLLVFLMALLPLCEDPAPSNSPRGCSGYCDQVPDAANPCTDFQDYWPLRLTSKDYPFYVHYPSSHQKKNARQVLDYMTQAWQVEEDLLEFSAPASDGLLCGPDERYDVFLWPGIIESYVAALGENESTTADDQFTYMVIDPDGPYGGDILAATVAHEWNHAMQAEFDWWEAAPFFEMSAVFIENFVFPEQVSSFDLVTSFQKRPHWAVDYNDGYQTWYMYGAALYVYYLYDRFFPNDPGFIGRVWSGAAARLNNSGEVVNPSFIESLQTILQNTGGTSFKESVVEFAYWRYFTGPRDVGQHFRLAHYLPDLAIVPVTSVGPLSVGEGATTVASPKRLMLLGSAYLEVNPGNAATIELQLSAAIPNWMQWSVQSWSPDGQTEPQTHTLDGDGKTTIDALAGDNTMIGVTLVPTGDYERGKDKRQRYALEFAVRGL